MKRYACLIVFLVTMLLALVMPGAQAAEYKTSGDLSVQQPSKAEIREKWASILYTDPEYKQKPSISAPYKAGALTEKYLESGVSYLNFIRYIAHMPSVVLDADISETAQYGATLLAANDVLTHFPDKPSDMPQDFYERGAGATSSSNLSWSWGFEQTLAGAVQGCMEDDDMSNVDRVGHRRWLLNPELYYVGFGQAQSKDDGTYIVTKVFDRSAEAFDYDFVSWPSTGSFPNNVFSRYVPWSITLNPAKYKTYDLDDVQVTLTRETDGETWKFDLSMDDSDYYGDYMTVDYGGYGISNCIIFRPNIDDIDYYKGVYTVTVSGLHTYEGQDETLNYQVDFFDADIEIVSQPQSVCVKKGETANVTVEAEGEGLTYTWYVRNEWEWEYKKSSVKRATYSVKMSDSTKNRALYCVVKDKYGNTEETNTVYLWMAPTITAQPKTVYAQKGKTAEVEVKAKGELLTYTWYYKDAGKSKYTKSSVTDSVYSVKMNSTRRDRAVYCVVEDWRGNTVKSDVAYLRMTPTITAQPKTVYKKSGQTASVTVKAEGNGLTYTWYYKDAGKSQYSKSSVTGATYSVNMNNPRKNRAVYCVIKDQYGKTAKSDVVYLRMSPTVITQPKSVSAKIGAKARVTINAEGNGLSYTWYVKDAGQSKYTKSSVTGTTYSITMNESRKNRSVYCLIKDKFGKTVKSDVVYLRMAPIITSQPKTVYAKNGETARVTVKAKGEGLTYTWYVKDAGQSKYTKSSVNRSSYSITMNSARKNRVVYCVVKDKYGSVATTGTATLKMK